MKDPSGFDAFYADVRDRLLHQTYALTGDLPASQTAVRDSFIHAWHHWRKVSHLPDPEAWARPVAWAHARRRSGARIWHRDKSTDPEVGRTLDALGRLTDMQRSVLVLAHLTSQPLEALAKEVGLPRDAAERELQTATSQYALHRGADSATIRASLEALRAPTTDAPWPRSTIIRRAGTARRRGHAFVGVAAVVSVLVLSGLAVTRADGVHPQLAKEQERVTLQPLPELVAEPPADLSTDEMLAADQVSRVAPKLAWAVDSTQEDAEVEEPVLPCQSTPAADPRSQQILVRSFAGTDAAGRTGKRAAAPATAYQSSELSPNARAAHRAFTTTAVWYAGCAQGQVQLQETRRVSGVGDEATMVVLRSWGKTAGTMVVGVARTGRVTTTTMSSTATRPRLDASGTLLAAAVNGLCGTPGSGRCASPPRLVPAPPIPVGVVPGMLDTVDLPQVTQIRQPWVGTEPTMARANAAATQCDQTDFTGPAVSHALTRSFLIPEAQLPDTFGLTQTVATLPAPRAAAFVETIRKRLATCEDDNLGTTVTRVVNESTKRTDLTVWNVQVEISDQQTVTYLMGVTRAGSAVAQVGFTPTSAVRMAPGDFLALVRRAEARLPQMPAPKKAERSSG
jgi:DNA-directed RNA polymerase specialized sigma24 family protein